MLRLSVLTALLFSGAIFGFFYAWVCSTLWGLDQIDPRTAITAMNAMNISVRNAVFFPIFFLTPIVSIGAALVCYAKGARSAAVLLAAAAVIYLMGAFLPTAQINVPMNRALEAVTVPSNIATAQEIWSAYSAPWQFWNGVRTVASGFSLLCVGIALTLLPRV